MFSHGTLHPATKYREEPNKSLVCEILESPLSEAELDADLRQRHLSLRAAAREIPPVFGSI
jgi:hypothetical protein